MRYVAFGLQVSSPFALPGMIERADAALPALELDIATRSSVQAGWDACGAERIWEGTLGDERTLLVQRSTAGEHLFTYGGEALFELDGAGEHLACAPSEAGVAWQRVLLSKVLANVSLIRGYEALHASAVESPQGAVVVLAPSGTGKTALALALAHGGWPLLSDDILMLGLRRGRGAGAPGHAARERRPADPLAARHAPPGRRARRPRRGAVAGRRSSTREPRARCVRCACCSVRPSLSLSLERMPASPLALMPYMLGLCRGDRAGCASVSSSTRELMSSRGADHGSAPGRSSSCADRRSACAPSLDAHSLSRRERSREWRAPPGRSRATRTTACPPDADASGDARRSPARAVEVSKRWRGAEHPILDGSRAASRAGERHLGRRAKRRRQDDDAADRGGADRARLRPRRACGGSRPAATASATSAWSRSCPRGTAACTRACACATSWSSGRASRWPTPRGSARAWSIARSRSSGSLSSPSIASTGCRWASASGCAWR